jgi:hypothetical protein
MTCIFTGCVVYVVHEGNDGGDLFAADAFQVSTDTYVFRPNLSSERPLKRIKDFGRSKPDYVIVLDRFQENHIVIDGSIVVEYQWVYEISERAEEVWVSELRDVDPPEWSDFLETLGFSEDEDGVWSLPTKGAQAVPPSAPPVAAPAPVWPFPSEDPDDREPF